MHGQAVDFRLPQDYGEAGAFGGPPEPLVPAGQDGAASGLPPAGAAHATLQSHVHEAGGSHDTWAFKHKMT
jgi:hypothetical protein